QGRPVAVAGVGAGGAATPGAGGGPAPTIIQHADVRRMLLSMRASIEAMRALAMYAALQFDLARALPGSGPQRAALLRGELLIPVVKGWCTETAFELVSQALQVHGGMGYIEETGIAQTLRDARITTIYEGTTAIQANDLLGRKLGRDGGETMRALLDEVDAELRDYRNDTGHAELPVIVAAVREAVTGLRAATTGLLPQLAGAPATAYAVSVPYLKLCGCVLGGWLMARAAHIAAARLGAAGAATAAGGRASGGDQAFMRAKLQSARCYAAQVLPQALALSRVVRAGGASIAEADADLI
ncbi:MAG: acyl-CoA dehydrogenase, partial [Gammaproteobacteria bacterium]|nr:acyl-CoA dehydrogenase [Gammaproteobacteria bacterium]